MRTALLATLALATLVALVLIVRHRARAGRDRAPGVTMVDPNDLVFSLPTLADRMPEGVKAEAAVPGAFHMHEDDWRQVEFVGRSQADAVEAELGRLRTFMARHRKGVGFTEVHVRSERPEGLVPLGIGADRLESLLPDGVPRRRLVVGGAPWGPVIVSGYAIDLGPDATAYVEVIDGRVATIGLPLSWRHGTVPAADTFLSVVARTLDLRLVDWPAARWVPLG
jgi:hypothetical protein